MNTKPIVIEICTGTACFVLGGSELMMLSEHIPEYLQQRVEVKGVNCLDLCRKNPAFQPPFVRMNGQIIPEADIQTVLTVLETIREE